MWNALQRIDGIPGITVSQVLGWGKARAADAKNTVIAATTGAARTGNVGDGKVFVHDLSSVVKIRTGGHGEIAI